MFLRFELIEEKSLFSICTLASLQSKLTMNAKTENKKVNSATEAFKISFHYGLRVVIEEI